MRKNFSISGVPDFDADSSRKRNYIIQIIKKHFELFGFSSIQTSSIEKKSTLLGNYGNEGEKLIFQILNGGNFLSKVDKNIKNISSNELSPLISSKVLRYDLTVPLAKFVSENYNDLVFPFKRYEIGKVWRAERPQKGRLREFTQCDADIVGDSSQLSELDILLLSNSIFKELKINSSVVKVNNRKILEGIFDSFNNNKVSFNVFCTVIDKLDKIGMENVISILKEYNFSSQNILILKKLFNLDSDFPEKKQYIRNNIKENSKLNEGINELDFLFNNLKRIKVNIPTVNFDLSLARGLDYYTSTVFEVTEKHLTGMSMAGGGRYDNLTERFGIKNISGVGISFGIDRIYMFMELNNLFPKDLVNSVDVMFVNFGSELIEHVIPMTMEIRNLGFSCEIYSSQNKISKQMSYANKRNIKFVVIFGQNEFKSNILTIKNMKSSEQIELSFAEFKDLLLKTRNDV